MKIKTRNINILVLHTLIGVLIGLFLLHPITMVIYWFEFNHVELTFKKLIEVASNRVLHSFSQHMFTMSASFALIGGMTGLGSGFYYRILRKKNKTIRDRDVLIQKGIVAIIHEGENEKVEFKSSLRYDFRKANVNKELEHVILKSITGFLNNKGGLLIIGIDDDGRIIGLANDYFSLKSKNKNGFERRIIQLVTEKLGGDISSLISLTFHNVADYEICSISIEPSHRPVYHREGEQMMFYLRSGNITQALNTMETVEYLRVNKVQFPNLLRN